MSKLILFFLLILQANLSTTCYSQYTNQYIPVNGISDDCWQMISAEGGQKIRCYFSKENQAHFPGGKDSLTSFINRNLNWPPTIFCGQGKVYAEFIVDSSGVLKDTKIVHGICESYDKEALRIISIMPNWIPAKNKKQIATESKINLPIQFKFD